MNIINKRGRLISLNISNGLTTQSKLFSVNYFIPSAFQKTQHTCQKTLASKFSSLHSDSYEAKKNSQGKVINGSYVFQDVPHHDQSQYAVSLLLPHFITYQSQIILFTWEQKNNICLTITYTKNPDQRFIT